jgi:hypothetical protein
MGTRLSQRSKRNLNQSKPVECGEQNYIGTKEQNMLAKRTRLVRKDQTKSKRGTKTLKYGETIYRPWNNNIIKKGTRLS